MCTTHLFRKLLNARDFLINVFAEKGYSITVSEKVTKKYMKNITSKKKTWSIETIKNNKIVKLPWVSKLGPKLRNEFLKFGIKTIFTLRHNLKNFNCRSKSKLLSNSILGAYQLDCTCNTLYIAKTRSLLEP